MSGLIDQDVVSALKVVALADGVSSDKIDKAIELATVEYYLSAPRLAFRDCLYAEVSKLGVQIQ